MKSTDPEIFADYFLLHRIAVGGMAEVFLAQRRQQPDADLVVIKRMHEQMCSDPNFVAMFRDEHRLIKRLQHPNIIRVDEFGQDGDRYYIAMEQVWGESLSTLSSQCNRQSLPFPFAAALYICAETAAALAHAHSLQDENGKAAPVIHRDVTLGNVMVAYDGQIKVLDFGIAKAEDREAKTRIGQIKGTLAYLAPEQVLGSEVGPATDIYQLGVLLYKLLVGREPFTGQKEIEVMEQIIRGDVVKPSSVIADFPSIIEALLQRAMAKKAKNRFRDMAEFERVLRAVMGQGFAPPKEKLRRIVATITADREIRQRAFIEKLREGIATPKAEVRELLSWAENKDEPKTLVVELGTRMMAKSDASATQAGTQLNQVQKSGGDTIISDRPELSSADLLSGETNPNMTAPSFLQPPEDEPDRSDESGYMDVFREAGQNEALISPAEFRSVEVLSHVTQVSQGGIADLLQLLDDEAPLGGDVSPSPWTQPTGQILATNPVRGLELSQELPEDDDDDRETQIAVRLDDLNHHSRHHTGLPAGTENKAEDLTLEMSKARIANKRSVSGVQPLARDESIIMEPEALTQVEELQVELDLELKNGIEIEEELVDMDDSGSESKNPDAQDVFESTFDDIDFDIDVVEED